MLNACRTPNLDHHHTCITLYAQSLESAPDPGLRRLPAPPSATMDSPIVTRIFRELFRHPACRSRQNFSRLRQAAASARHFPGRLPQQHQQHQHSQRRHYAVKTRLPQGEGTNESVWKPRSNLFPADRSAEFDAYETVTAEDLKGRTTRPQKVKMLMRDFVDGMFFMSLLSSKQRQTADNLS